MPPDIEPTVSALIRDAVERAFADGSEQSVPRQDQEKEEESEGPSMPAPELVAIPSGGASGEQIEGSASSSPESAGAEPRSEPQLERLRHSPDRIGGAVRTDGSVDRGEPPTLFSASPDDRRGALSRLRATGIGATAVADVARMLLEDPDPGLRRSAAEALRDVVEAVSPEAITRALQDPDDGVRAAVVGLAGERGHSATAELIPLITGRQWPLSQEAALRTLLSLVRPPHFPRENDVEALVDAVGELDPLPLASERLGLEALAKAVGSHRLTPTLRGSAHRRLGAAWLLFLEGSPSSLALVAALADDESDAVRNLAGRADGLLRRLAKPADRSRGAGRSLVNYPEPPEEMADQAVVSALVRALTDPDQTVRDAARSALQRANRERIGEWIENELRSGSERTSALAATAAQHLGRADAAGLILQRASQIPPEARGPYLAALASLPLDPSELVELVPSVGPAHRQVAVRLAWQLGGRAVAPFLSSLLTDSAGPVRMATLEVIGDSGDPAGIALAQDLLRNDSSAPVRATAVHILVRAGEETGLRALATALADPDPDVRATAIEALPPGLAGAAVESLLRAMRDTDDRVWQATIRHLAALPDRESAVVWAAIRDSSRQRREGLVRHLESEDPSRLENLAMANTRAADRSDRALAIELAARVGTPQCTAAVVAALEDPDPGIRRTAASAMSILRTPLAVDSLARTLFDPHPDVRVAAVRTLGLIDDDSVPPILISALKDPEIRVRDMAVESLTGWRSPTVARRLAAALASPDLRRAVGDVLERMGDTAVPALVEVVMGSDPEAVAQAGSVLDRIAGASAFVGGLTSVDPEERLRSVEVLGAIGGRSAADALLTALDDPEIRVRVRSAALLGALGEVRAEVQLKRMVLSDPVAEVAAAAEAALRTLETLPHRSGVGLPTGDEVPEDYPTT